MGCWSGGAMETLFRFYAEKLISCAYNWPLIFVGVMASFGKSIFIFYFYFFFLSNTEGGD
jgi:hypothetical protein